MKKFFNYLALALVLALGTAACSNADVDAPVDESATGDRSVKLKVIIPGSSTYAGDEESYNAKKPAITDAIIFFVDTLGQTIKRKQIVPFAQITTLTSTGVTVDGIPASANAYYILGNVTDDAESTASNGALTNEAGGVSIVDDVAEGDALSVLKTIMVKIENQVGPTAKIVLLGKGEYVPQGSGIGLLQATLRPLVSRIEIAKVTADQTVAADDKVTSFDLTGIYINNTYKMIGIDPAQYPSLSTNAIAYAYNDAVWTSIYPADYHIALSETSGTSYTPSGVWGFNVVPAQKKNPTGSNYIGNTILVDIEGSGVSRPHGAVPLIVLKLENVQVNGASISPTTKYVTVSRYKDNTTTLPIDFFKNGYIYAIGDIKFSAKHLVDSPTSPSPGAASDVYVVVDVKGWEELDTIAEI
ncbi:MAG: hypothetical protein LBR26_12390 [Prevotella sp.]|jgi:hypothetical protein|nr:hypothetical protein [Prevotella sp.]